jgi:aquaporin Z
MVLVYMCGHLSGGHFNPAVTLSVIMRLNLPWKDGLAYMAAQVLGAFVGAGIALGFTGNTAQVYPSVGEWRYNVGEAFVVEALFSLLLCSVVLNTATTKSQSGNQHFGLAIGFTVVCGAYACAPISGGVFNPAVGLGLLSAHGWNGEGIHHMWIFLVAPFLGAVGAGGLFLLTNAREFHFATELGGSERNANLGNYYFIENAVWWQKGITEFVGAFYLALQIGLVQAARDGSSPFLLGPLSIGSMLMVLVYRGGHLSGGHYNPAVSLACWVRGVLDIKLFGIYVASQMMGALVGSAVAVGITHESITITPPDELWEYTAVSAFFAEAIFTFVLAYVVLNCATTKSQDRNSFFGLAIGWTVSVGAWASGPISGAVMNPALGFGFAITHAANGGNVGAGFLFMAAQFLAGAAAGMFFRWSNRREFHQD